MGCMIKIDSRVFPHSWNINGNISKQNNMFVERRSAKCHVCCLQFAYPPKQSRSLQLYESVSQGASDGRNKLFCRTELRPKSWVVCESFIVSCQALNWNICLGRESAFDMKLCGIVELLSLFRQKKLVGAWWH